MCGGKGVTGKMMGGKLLVRLTLHNNEDSGNKECM